MGPFFDVHIPTHLKACLDCCQTEFVVECCGIDAFSSDDKVIRDRISFLSEFAVRRAVVEIDQIVEELGNKGSDVVSVPELNPCTIDQEARRKLFGFLSTYRAALISKLGN